MLEANALVHTEAAKARKGQHQISSASFDGVGIRLEDGKGFANCDQDIVMGLRLER